VVTYFAQKGSGAISSLERVPLDLRVANALVSYVRYIGKTIMPHRLALLYPLPLSVPWWQTLGALVILIVVSFFAVKTVKRYPYFTVGWFWYLGTLIPVIGLVQVGIQAMADRYTYVPLIGLFIAVTWGFHEVLSKIRYGKLATAAVAGCFLVNFVAITWFQVHRWVDSITLFRHTLAVTKDNFGLKNNLGDAYLRQGRIQEAIDQFQDAIRIKPDFGLARDNLATALTLKEKFQGNIPALLKNLESNPNDFMLHFRLGNLYDLDGDLTEAIHHYQKALSIQPEYVPLFIDLGIAYAKTGAYEKSLSLFEKALSFDPENNETHYIIACIYARQTKPEDAVVWLQKAVQKGYNNWKQIESDVNLDNIRQDVRFRKIISGR
jgi:tetratricopeptide (TPR) repeat protein